MHVVQVTINRTLTWMVCYLKPKIFLKISSSILTQSLKTSRSGYIAIIQVHTQCYGENGLPGDLFFVGLSTDKSITVRYDENVYSKAAEMFTSSVLCQ